IRQGKYPQEGLSLIAHIKGLLGQRLWFYNKTTGYTDKLKISDSCVGCGLCSKVCPMENIQVKDNLVISGSRCTMCYRCISLCPQKAITLLGDTVQEQCRFEKYAQ
ncbi:MAG: EFR1 family ferrodoxin, partial [Oscillospiraceae bacterium]|nr:EFR1 family ferrodoxin [Oscillospiraceae bacterium]